MKNLLVLGILLILLPRDVQGQDSAAEVFRRGNQLYEAGDFSGAMVAYEDLLTRGFAAPELEYNLGNAALKAGRIGSAILHYRRALRLRPNYENAWVNLNYARSLTQDVKPESAPAEGRGWLARARLGPGRAAALLWTAVLIVALLGVWRRLGANVPAWLSGVQWGALALMLVCMAAVVFEWSQVRGSKEGVVMALETEVRVGPSPDQTVSFRLHEGTEVDLLRAVPGWVDVRVSPELQGWVPETAVQTI